MATLVTCKDCGFLAIRNKQTRELCEVEIELRNGDEFPATYDEPGPDSFFYSKNSVYDERPVCFARKSFPTEEYAVSPRIGAERFREVIARKRHCDSFTEWKHGFSPREHMEMMLSEKLLLEQRLWQEEQNRIADERHKESIAIANHSVNTAYTGALLGAFATLIAGGLAVWSASNSPAPERPMVNQTAPSLNQ